MQSNHKIGSLVLYQGDEKAKVFYKSEASYAELLAVNQKKATLNLLMLNVIVEVPLKTVCLTSVSTRKKEELAVLMRFYLHAYQQVLGYFPSIKSQKKCLKALIQSFEISKNKLTTNQAIKVIMNVIRLYK
jgi:hypothetical protein